MSKLWLLVASLCLVSAATPASAYIGPGAGITMLGALWGVVVAVALALGAVLFWPVRALLRRRKRPAETPATSAPVSSPLPRDGVQDPAR